MAQSLPMIATDVLDVRITDAGHAAAVASALGTADEERWVERLHERDTSLWTSDPAVAEKIANRLGWLDSPRDFSERTAALEAFGTAIRDAGFKVAVVAGMGGSSLAPDVLVHAFPDVGEWVAVRVLDSTDPATVRATYADLDPLATLVIVASKSGTTTEPLAFQAEAWERIHAALRAAGERREGPGELMVAVTDPGHSLESIPHHDSLREVFLNPEDIGGRYSALSYVGLVPASLMGLDLDALLASGVTMLARCMTADPAANPGAALGLVLGALAREGVDKLTFVADPPIARFGAWLEQLIAESTGKRGVGIVPIDGEPLGAASAYGTDRVFVRLSLEGATPPVAPGGSDADELMDLLAHAGHPVIRIGIGDPIDLAGEFVRWEVATALAGAVLGINPFDEPNVTESKDNTKRVLADLEHKGSFASSQPLATTGGIALFGDMPLRVTGGDMTVAGVLRRHLGRIVPSSYIALQAFVGPSPERAAALDRIRARLRDATRRPVTMGFGPRFLHSTGQLHKGGAPIGCFIQLTSDHPSDLAIPGRHFTFGQLIDAQAIGDFQALEAHDLPVLRVHLGADPDAGLAELERLVVDATS